MNNAEAFVIYLRDKCNVTDSFGIPGGVVLRLIDNFYFYNQDNSCHLMYHEQAASFAAIGYALSSNKLGVAYATKGPGILNMVTAIAEAYQESVPVLFITSYSNKNDDRTRFEHNQEVDIVACVKHFTKYADYIDTEEDFIPKVINACNKALQGRKGPVLLNINSKLWIKDVLSYDECLLSNCCSTEKFLGNDYFQIDNIVNEVNSFISESKRPVILIGDGIRQADAIDELCSCLKDMNIPVLSSRGAQGIYTNNSNYFGYIGSHGCRYSNQILSKADSLIVLGNRLAFPINSQSFRPVVENKKIIRIDIDDKEFSREIPNAKNYCIDVKEFLKKFNLNNSIRENFHAEWLQVCNKIKSKLLNSDVLEPVEELKNLLCNISDVTIVCDVGNNEFWTARTYELVRPKADIVYSKSFGTLGSALCKAIGVYYATQKPVVVISGDQGIQFNIQELHYISQWKLPITVVVLNNNCSAMIKDHEQKMCLRHLVHVTPDSGYSSPNFEAIAKSYGFSYLNNERNDLSKDFKITSEPLFVEIKYKAEYELAPYLEKGKSCEDMSPLLDRSLLSYLHSL